MQDISSNLNFKSLAGDTATEVDEIRRRKNFSPREVGITHPDNTGFIRITDSGDIEIFAAPGVGIIISAATKTIALFADNIKLNSKEDGLRWNMNTFNSSATDFSEPAMIPMTAKDTNPGFKNADYFINNIKDSYGEDFINNITIKEEYENVTETEDALAKGLLFHKNTKESPMSKLLEAYNQSEVEMLTDFWTKNQPAISKAFTSFTFYLEFLKQKTDNGFNISQILNNIAQNNGSY